jgi:hypothetical protein
MVGAKQLRTLGLSRFRPGPYVQQGCARGTVLLRTGVLVEGWLQAGRERRSGLQVPRGVIEASANIVGETESVRLTATRCLYAPAAGGSPPFYRPRRGQFTGMPHYFATCGGMAYNAVELTDVLANFAPVTASWRVLCLKRGDFEGRGVVVDRGVFRRARGSCWQRSVRGAVAGVAASRPRVLNSVGAVVAVRGVAQQGRGWPLRIDSDGDGAPAGLTSRSDPAESREEGSRVRPASLRGRGALAVQEWAAQCHGADTGLVTQFPTVVGMGSP